MGNKLCIITGGRQDYSYLYWLMKNIQSDPALELQIIATGTHLSPKHGFTYDNILKDRFRVTMSIPVIGLNNSEMDVITSMGNGCSLFVKAFQELEPDIVVLLGDRYEIFSAAIAAYLLKIPIAHLHGGEVTEGAVDEAFRHSITKMASIHFTAALEYRNRVVQLGEQPDTVFCVGTLSLEAIKNERTMQLKDIMKSLDIDFKSPLAIATYHPETLDSANVKEKLNSMLKAIDFSGLSVVFTKANSDANGDIINNIIETFCQTNPSRYILVNFLGRRRYFGCLKHFDLMIGNSSSGVIEAPSFKLPVVNIGDREKGRIHSKNVINTDYNVSNIISAIQKALSEQFKESIVDMKSAYMTEKNNASDQIIFNIKRYLDSSKSLKKEFYNYECFLKWVKRNFRDLREVELKEKMKEKLMKYELLEFRRYSRNRWWLNKGD